MKGRPLFIVGNKRSGTSLLVRLLDMHPRIFVSHESDIVWILYQFHARKPFEAHPWDSRRGMDLTLSSCGYLLRHDRSPIENFHTVLNALMEAGNPWLPAMTKGKLDWIGDKKPFQHTDPILVDFILLNLPGARFVHIVRHPFAVAASSARFNRTPNGDFWKDTSLQEKVERWLFHEEQVLELKQRVGDQLVDVRYEDLCEKPVEEISRLLRFLDLDSPSLELVEKLKQETAIPRSGIPAIKCSERSRAVAALYDYSLPRPEETRRLSAIWARLTGKTRGGV